MTYLTQVGAFVQRNRLRKRPFVPNDLGIEKAAGTRPEQCPVTQDKSEVSVGRSSVLI